jgi:hypothetical protein
VRAQEEDGLSGRSGAGQAGEKDPFAAREQDSVRRLVDAPRSDADAAQTKAGRPTSSQVEPQSPVQLSSHTTVVGGVMDKVVRSVPNEYTSPCTGGEHAVCRRMEGRGAKSSRLVIRLRLYKAKAQSRHSRALRKCTTQVLCVRCPG